MPVEPTWAQVNCLIVLMAVSVAFAVYAWFRGKREEERTVTSRDWDKYERRKRNRW